MIPALLFQMSSVGAMVVASPDCWVQMFPDDTMIRVPPDDERIRVPPDDEQVRV